ncbi:hypothetical protein [Winogradskyella sp.]|uniref:hypothetical protein n=1 Tax=Winogradskyella sp. TaxID=1883156 RepID=UPI003F6BDC92
MKIGFVLLNICFVLLISCGEDKGLQVNNDKKSAAKQTIINAKEIENFIYTDYALSPEGEDAVSQWEKYRELAIQITYLKKADLSFFNGDIELLKTFVTELKAGIPDQLQTNSINSRVLVVENTLLKLHDDLTLSNIDVKKKRLSIRDVLVAFSNLNLQINRKIEFDIYNEIKPE